jgi:hypothetical protein
MQGLLRAALLTTALVCPAIGAQDVNTVRAWNQTLAEVIRDSQDPIGKLTPDVLSRGEKAANALLADEKPAQISAEQWRKMQATAYKVLGWAGVMSVHGPPAIENFERCLELDPSDVSVSSELVKLFLQERPSREAEALFQQARMAEYDGPGALPAPQRRRLEDRFLADYEFFHGSEEGLDKVKELARSQALPPPDFTIEPNRTSPSLMALRNMQGTWTGELTAPDGASTPSCLSVALSDAGAPSVSIGPDKSHLTPVLYLRIMVGLLTFQSAGEEKRSFSVYYRDGSLFGAVRAANGQPVGKLQYHKEQ